MCKVVEFDAIGAFATSVFIRRMLTGDITGVCNGQRKFSNSFATAKQLGMCNLVFLHILYQLLLELFLSYNISEKHFNIWLLLPVSRFPLRLPYKNECLALRCQSIPCIG